MKELIFSLDTVCKVREDFGLPVVSLAIRSGKFKATLVILTYH